MGKDDAKKAAKLKRQQKAAEKAGAVAKKDKVDEVDEVGEAIKDAANTLGNVLNIASSKASANAELAKARNVTGEITCTHVGVQLVQVGAAALQCICSKESRFVACGSAPWRIAGTPAINRDP
jgi:hypothetical protein